MTTTLPSPEIVRELAPTGTLRVSINLGNIVLADRDETTGALSGVTVELAQELGKRLGVQVALHPFEGAGQAFEAAKAGAIDIVFLAIEPKRAEEIAFTAPYVLIEGVYAVPDESRFRTTADVDQAGVRVAVNEKSAYDLYLTRTLKHATLARGEDGADLFVREKLEVLAGVRQAVALFVKRTGGLRIVDGRFMEIRQAMGTPKSRDAGARYLHGFVEEMKASGFVADALRRNNQPDATVAPAG